MAGNARHLVNAFGALMISSARSDSKKPASGFQPGGLFVAYFF
jgi:hypothetical protein